MPLFGRKTECQVISESLSRHHDGNFGFVVYRCVYGNDEEWERFLKRLEEYASAALGRVQAGEELIGKLVWEVRDAREVMGMSGVKGSFKGWAASVNGHPSLTRYTKLIYADAEVIASILGGEDPHSTAPGDVLRPKAFVKIVDARFREIIKPGDPEDFDSEEALRRHDEGDEGYAPIEGCRRFDVGWMWVPARRLVPFAYQKLMGNGWGLGYVRPPGVWDD